MSATRLLNRSLRPKRSNETAELVEVVGAEHEDCTPRRFGSNSGTALYRHDIRFVSTSSDPRSPEECYRRARFPISVGRRDSRDRRDS
jgi:hypothetical protein